ncbi:MAG: YifB family Mg chelatase-like AAA ATPase [Aquificae bacterium]|nr:YifB family Mg chelatase-like AAA ATPase [Aquificota bacterium]
MLSVVKSGGFLGIDGYPVDVEVNVSAGLPQFITVGLPDTAVKESRERVRSAITNTGFNFPVKKIVVNLAPANTPKQGTLYDLPIAVGILSTAGVFNSEDLQDFAFIGELALDGTLRKINGAMPIALALKEAGIKNLILPEENSLEACVVDGINVYGFKNLREIVDFFNGSLNKEPEKISDRYITADYSVYPDFAQVRGQHLVKKALEIAAAGFHNILMIGTPGSGKSMMAKTFPSILPPMDFEEAIETTKIYSVAGLLEDFMVKNRPFRSPHHTSSDVALIGGGNIPKPGEVSLAHNGVLFLDEFPEFKRTTLEALRQPLEDREVVISRASGRYKFPAKFQLVAAANPCPCGYKGDPNKECQCTPAQIRKYKNKMSGPILDRIDLITWVSSVPPEELAKMKEGEKSESIRERVISAVEIQRKRFKGLKINFNSEMTPDLIKKFVKLEDTAENILLTAVKKYSISTRGFFRILKVSRTIADLDRSDSVKSAHIIQAVNFRITEG